MQRNCEDEDEASQAKELLLEERARKEAARQAAMLARAAHDRQNFLRLGPLHEEVHLLKARISRMPMEDLLRAAVDLAGGLDAARNSDTSRDKAIAELEQQSEARSHATRSLRNVGPWP